MIKKITLALLVITLIAITTTENRSYKELIKYITYELAPETVEIYQRPKGDRYLGPTKIISTRVVSTGYWATKLEITYHHSSFRDVFLTAKTPLESQTSRNLGCGKYEAYLRPTYESQPKTITVWASRPINSHKEILTKSIEISTNKKCGDIKPQKVAQYKTPITWPSAESEGLSNNNKLTKSPDIHIGTGVENFQSIATQLANNGYSTAQIYIYPSEKNNATRVSMNQHIRSKLLKPIFTSLSKLDQPIDVWINHQMLPNCNCNGIVKIGLANKRGRSLSKTNLQKIVSNDLSDEEAYALMNLKWINDSDKARHLIANAKVMMDNGNRHLETAKKSLDEAFSLDANIPELYIELARYHMKSNRDFNEYTPSSTGKYVSEILTKAHEQYPNHANILVLLGYVQTTQNNFNAAEKSYSLAEKIGTDNWWLWNNQGLLYRKKLNPLKAINMYSKVADHDSVQAMNKNAYSTALWELTKLLIEQKNYQEADKYFSKHHRTIPNFHCSMYRRHSAMLTDHTDEFDRAIELAKTSINRNCSGKSELSKALYHKWHQEYLHSGNNNASLLIQAKSASTNQAKVFYDLAATPSGPTILNALSQNGEDINLTWKGNSALMLAIKSNNLAATRVLLLNGVDANFTPIDSHLSPLALAVAKNNIEIVELLISHGANALQKNKQGFSAVDIARQMRYQDILNLLGGSRI